MNPWKTSTLVALVAVFCCALALTGFVFASIFDYGYFLAPASTLTMPMTVPTESPTAATIAKPGIGGIISSSTTPVVVSTLPGVITTVPGFTIPTIPTVPVSPTRPYFIKIEGTVVSVTESDENKIVKMKVAGDAEAYFVMDDDTLFYGEGLLEAGHRLCGFYRSEAIMTMIYPPRYPIAVVCATPIAGYKVVGDKFYGEPLTSSDHTMSLSIGASTRIVDMKNRPFTGASVAGYPLLVFYADPGSSSAYISPVTIVVAVRPGEPAGDPPLPPIETVPITIPTSTEPPPAPPAVDPTEPAASETQEITLTIGSTVVSKGKALLPAPDVAPEIMNGRTMLPMRYVVETLLGGDVAYTAATQHIVANVKGHVVEMTIGVQEITVDGEKIDYGQSPIIKSGRTLVPLRAFDKLVKSIRWDADTKTVTIVP